MKKLLTKFDILTQYINSGLIMYKATLDGDYRVNNREGKKIINLFKHLENNLQLAMDTLPVLFDNENVVTRTKAAAHCLALNIYINEAEKVLENACQDKNNGIFGFNAEMTLKVWRDNGFLQVYQK
jgi:hypothetical protein